jgi:hypothetical protein
MLEGKDFECEPAFDSRELTVDELQHVAGGTKPSTHQPFLVFTFKLVAVKTVSW